MNQLELFTIPDDVKTALRLRAEALRIARLYTGCPRDKVPAAGAARDHLADMEALVVRTVKRANQR